MPDSSLDYFITFQERVFISYVLGPAKRIVNTTGFWKLNGPLNDEALRIALDTVAKRNTSLRMYYEQTATQTEESVERAARYPGEPNYRRHIAAEVTPTLDIQIIEHMPEEAREDYIRSWGQNENKRPIDLLKAPLFTCSVLHAGEETHYIALTLFHTLADNIALGVILQEISDAYNTALAGHAPDTTPKKPDLYDVLKWLRGKTRDPKLKQQSIDYWADYLKGFTDLHLKTDTTPGEKDKVTLLARRALLDFRLPMTLKAFEANHGKTGQGLAFGAYALMLSTMAPGQTILSNNPMSGRFAPEFEGVTGYWLAMRLAKASIDPDQSALAFVRALEKDYDEANKHSFIDFNSILTAMLSRGAIPADFFKRRTASHIMFNCLGFEPAPTFTFKDATCAEVSTTVGQTLPCHFNGEVRIDGDHVTGVIACWEQHYSQASADGMAARYARILKSIMTNPDAKLADVLKV